MNYKIVYFLLILFGIISISLGGTFAYWTWTTSENQRTEVVFTIEEDFKCSADGGGNITSSDIILAPADCTNSKFAIQREIKVTPTIFGDNPIRMDLWLDINNLGSGLSNSNNFKYALTTEGNSCTSGVIKTGNFNGKTQGDKVELFNYMGYTSSTEETYYLYVWLDKEETSTTTMNQSFNLSINGICTDAPEPQTYVVFNETDTTLRLYKRDENTSQISNNINDHSVSKLNNNIQTIEGQTISEEDKVYFDLENTTYSSAEQLPWYSYRDSITRVIVEDDIKPKSMNYWFDGMTNVEYIDVSNINTSRVTSMSSLFNGVGSNVTNSFEIVGLNNWNVSNVTNMNRMFQNVGKNATSWNIGNLSRWNVSNVTIVVSMFLYAGQNATTLNLNLSNWDLSNIASTESVFNLFGRNVTTLNLDLSNWNVSSVTNMRNMFVNCGAGATSWSIEGLSGWDVSSVTSMSYMFSGAGSSATTLNIGDISKWDVSSVIDMNDMFSGVGRNATYILDLSNWNVSNVTIYNNFNAGVWNKIIPPTWNTTS